MVTGGDSYPWNELLKTTNSDNWFMRMDALLQYEDLDSVLESSFALPSVDNPDYATMVKKVKKARTIIILGLEAADHKSIVDSTKEAKDLWAGLKGWAGQLNVQLNSVSKSFQSLEMQHNEKMPDHMTRASNLYDKLSKHEDFAQSELNGIIQIDRGLPDDRFNTEKMITESDTTTALLAGRGGPCKSCFNCGGNHFARDCTANKGPVAKGFTQKEEVDFGEVFAPVVKYTSRSALLAVVAQQGIKTAFLNGVLEEEDVAVQPPAYEQGGTNVTCHLHHALYGLRQAPHTWYVRLHYTWEQMRNKPSTADPGLFIKSEGENCVYILVYVDDEAGAT
ncbi:hypothetical protein Vretimale_3258 [Volvox reticuliferus]|uniref:Reverse transcriptase Ty1/copia-type domain-containing protein n=1 Tax=Volvox reticuliferus TaxID=1737510 RepID=A0A8J4D879_9CHLO|nr:hypothetical protein Vretifemale_6540 [Volvox reticuliferus]GIL97668.1 hypothetical protein Vretimale_3258 [Volvox reticuliferus]